MGRGHIRHSCHPDRALLLIPKPPPGLCQPVCHSVPPLLGLPFLRIPAADKSLHRSRDPAQVPSRLAATRGLLWRQPRCPAAPGGQRPVLEIS